MAIPQTKRTSVVLSALRVTLRCLEDVPSSPEAEKLRRRALAFEREAETWPAASPSNYEREAMMKQVLALHIEVTKFARAHASSK